MRDDHPITMGVDTVAARHYIRGEPALTWFALADDAVIAPGDGFVLRPEDGRARPVADGDGHMTWFRAVTGRVPAGTMVNGEYPAGVPG